MTAGFRDVQELAIRFAKENAEAGFARASDLANAKDIQGVLSLQSRYAQTPVQPYARQAQGACARQAQEFGRLMAEAMQSLKPGS